jgi:hypothetical protein
MNCRVTRIFTRSETKHLLDTLVVLGIVKIENGKYLWT